MTDETETGDVGAGMNADFEHDPGGSAIERGHSPKGIVNLAFGQNLPLESGGQDSGAERFGEYQGVPRPGAD